MFKGKGLLYSLAFQTINIYLCNGNVIVPKRFKKEIEQIIKQNNDNLEAEKDDITKEILQKMINININETETKEWHKKLKSELKKCKKEIQKKMKLLEENIQWQGFDNAIFKFAKVFKVMRAKEKERKG